MGAIQIPALAFKWQEYGRSQKCHVPNSSKEHRVLVRGVSDFTHPAGGALLSNGLPCKCSPSVNSQPHDGERRRLEAGNAETALTSLMSRPNYRHSRRDFSVSNDDEQSRRLPLRECRDPTVVFYFHRKDFTD